MTDLLARFGGRRRLGIALLLLAMFCVLVASYISMRSQDIRPKPVLLMMTTLPLRVPAAVGEKETSMVQFAA